GVVGLYVQASMGSYRPGFTPEVQDLHCIRHALRYYRYAQPTEVHIVAAQREHPLLADLKDLPSGTMMMTAVSGAIGEIRGGTPLMETTEQSMLGDWAEREATDT